MFYSKIVTIGLVLFKKNFIQCKVVNKRQTRHDGRLFTQDPFIIVSSVVVRHWSFFVVMRRLFNNPKSELWYSGHHHCSRAYCLCYEITPFNYYSLITLRTAIQLFYEFNCSKYDSLIISNARIFQNVPYFKYLLILEV